MKTLLTALVLAGAVSSASLAYAQSSMPTMVDEGGTSGTSASSTPRPSDDHTATSNVPPTDIRNINPTNGDSGKRLHGKFDILPMGRQNDEGKRQMSSTTMVSNLPARLMNPSVNSFKHRMGPPIVLSIDANGHIMLRGKLTSVSGSSLTVTSWGTVFTIDTTNAEVAGSKSGLSSFTVGDVVGVKGTVDQNGKGQVKADVVRDWGMSDGDQEKGQDMKSSDDQHDSVRTSSSTMPAMNDHHDSNMMEHRPMMTSSTTPTFMRDEHPTERHARNIRMSPQAPEVH